MEIEISLCEDASEHKTIKEKEKEKNLTKARVNLTRARARASMAKVRLRRVDRRDFRRRSPTCNFLLGSPVNAQPSAFELMREQRLRMIRIRRNSSNKIPKSGAMTDGSKRRHEAMVQTASDSEDDGSFSVVTGILELATLRQFFHHCPTACRLLSNGKIVGTILSPRLITKKWTLQSRNLHGFGTPMNGAAQS